jgi:hypothetical protein
LASGLLVVPDQAEALRRSGRETAASVKVREMLLEGLRNAARCRRWRERHAGTRPLTRVNKHAGG